MSPTLKQVLINCREVELGCARLYESFAHVFRAEPALSDLWAKTAREELQHADQIALVIRTAHETVLSVTVGAHEAEIKIAKLRSMVREASTRPPSVVDALRQAIALEVELGAFHADSAVVFADASTHKLMRALQAADQGHIGALKEALARAGGAR